jgi:hypothetical protein
VSELIPILEQFQLGGKVLHVEPFGTGNINDTYRSIVEGQTHQYIHQKINKHVFKHPDQVMENMALVTEHIRRTFQHEPSGRRRVTLEIIPSNDGALYYQDPQGEYWRTTVFIPDALAYDTIQSPTHAYEVGKVLGEFQQMVADISPERLHDTLPGYHHTPRYYAELLEAHAASYDDAAVEQRKREPLVTTLLNQVRQRESLIGILMQAYQSDALQERVVHNDPKINNILLDAGTAQGIGMIDLDTVKSGLIHFDYGDCLRTAANPAGEETQDIAEVCFDVGIFEAFTRGYIKAAHAFLSNDDVHLMVDAIKVIILEQTIRFLADYLRGDTYYKTNYPTHNLQRARVQMAMLLDLERQETGVRQILEAL